MPKSSMPRRRTEHALVDGNWHSPVSVKVTRSGYSVRQKGPEKLSHAGVTQIRKGPASEPGLLVHRTFAPTPYIRVNPSNNSAGDARRPDATKKLKK